MAGVEIVGSNVLIKAGNLGKLSDRAAKQAWWHSGRDLRKAASDEILRKPKSGRTYIRRDRAGRRRRHVASAPGETHANMTGALRRSLDFKVRSSKQLEFGYGITRGDAPEYARVIEFGNPRNKIQPSARPSLRNAIRATRRNIIGNFNRELKKMIK